MRDGWRSRYSNCWAAPLPRADAPPSAWGVAALALLLGAFRLSAADGVTAPPKPAPPLRITLLGTGNPLPLRERSGPAILVEASTTPPVRILVDAGRGAAEREGPTRKTYAGPLVVGEDLTVFDVGETVVVRSRLASDAGASMREPGKVAK